MGPIKHTDAQNIQIDDSMRKVLYQLDRPLSDMDTDCIDKQLDSVENIAASSQAAYEQTMRSAAAADSVKKVRTARRRMVKRTAALAAGLMMVAAGTFGVANAFQWNSFLRIFSAQNGILSFQTPVEKDANIDSLEADEDDDTNQQDESGEDPQDESITIASADELLALSTDGDKAFKPLLDKYTFQSGDLYKTETDSLLTLIFLDGSGNDLYIQVSTVNKEYIDHVASSVFFEIDDGSQKNVRIGDDTVITCTNLDINTVQWITQYGYCHLWSKASHEELLGIAKILLDAGLKPV
jgi:hypothetical protein